MISNQIQISVFLFTCLCCCTFIRIAHYHNKPYKEKNAQQQQHMKNEEIFSVLSHSNFKNKLSKHSIGDTSTSETEHITLEKEQLQSDSTYAMYTDSLSAVDKYALVNDISLLKMKKRSNNVVFTSWFTYARDPQRGHIVSDKTIEYIYNLYTTTVTLGMSLVIFHDSVSESIIKQYSTHLVTFYKVTPDRSYSTNDYRFVAYNEYMKIHDLDYVLMVDASDVFFRSNPFEYIHNHEHNHTLFMSSDIGTFHSNAWQVKKCYGTKGETWDQNMKMHNAGVWGGRVDVLQCVLDCITNQLQGSLHGKGNCNMPALNWCVSHGPCATALVIDDTPNFVNPFRKQCTENFMVVHNKCQDTEGKICVVIKDGEIHLKTKKGNCVRSEIIHHKKESVVPELSPEKKLSTIMSQVKYRNSLQEYENCCTTTNNGAKIPSMISPYACRLLSTAAQSIRSDAVVVEYGTWMGASSRCIGHGLMLRSSNVQNKLFSFDAFEAVETHKMKGTPWYRKYNSGQNSILEAWKEIVTEIYQSAVPIVGMLTSSHGNASSWGHEYVDYFVIDAAKDYDNFLIQIRHVFPYLRRGSLITFGDFTKPQSTCDQMTLVYSKFMKSGILRLVDVSETTSHWTYAVQRPFTESDMKDPMYPTEGFDSEEWNQLQKHAMHDFERVVDSKGTFWDDRIHVILSQIQTQFKTCAKKIKIYPHSNNIKHVFKQQKKPTEPEKVHVVYSADEWAKMGVETSITSLRNSASESVVVYFIGLTPLEINSDVNFISLKEVNETYNLNMFTNPRMKSGLGDLNSIANYVRFVLPQIFPTISKLLWIDADTIVRCDIVSMIRTSLTKSDYPVAAVPRQGPPAGISTMFTSNIKNSFNAGIFVVDTFRWQQQKITEKIKNWVDRNHNEKVYWFGSQPPMALAIGDNFEHLDPKWNLDGLGYKPNMHVPENTCVLHWTGSKKHWIKNGLNKDLVQKSTVFTQFYPKTTKYEGGYTVQSLLTVEDTAVTRAIAARRVSMMKKKDECTKGDIRDDRGAFCWNTKKIKTFEMYRKYRNENTFEDFARALTKTISVFFPTARSIGDFGASSGNYVRFYLKQGFSSHGYDGTAGIEEISYGAVENLNLAEPINDLIQFVPSYDVVACLEVGEHIPRQYTDVFLENIVSRTKLALFLTWATDGQPGNGHVNTMSGHEVKTMVEQKGMVYHEKATEYLRTESKGGRNGRLRDNVQVYVVKWGYKMRKAMMTSEVENEMGSALSYDNALKLAAPMTMVKPDFIEFVYRAVLKIDAENIAGDIVECGVWKGGMTMMMIFAHLKSQSHMNHQRHFWLFDTFEGLPEPKHAKDDPKAKRRWKQISDKSPGYDTGHVLEGKWNYAPIDLVDRNMKLTQYPRERIHMVKGKVEDTLPNTDLPAKIAILRLDTDWYESTKLELELLYDRLQVGGLLFVDDYFTWKGARMATDEFFESRNLRKEFVHKNMFAIWKKHDTLPG